MTTVVIGDRLTPEDIARVAREDAPVEISDSAREQVRASRDRVASVIDSDRAVYGINTGFGELVSERIPRDRLEQLQTNLVRRRGCAPGSSGAGRAGREGYAC